MDVNVIFKNKISIDNDKNFTIEFKNEKELISLLLTNAVIYLNEAKNEKRDKDIASIKKLEDEAKKHIDALEKNTFDAPFTKNFMITFGDDWLIDSFRPTYHFKFQEALMKDFLKTCQYYNIENEKKQQNFNVYDPLKHLNYGLIFDLDTEPTAKTKWVAPVNRIDFKINLNNKKVNVTVQQVGNNDYVEKVYEWSNKFVVIDTINLELVTSYTGLVKIHKGLIRIQGIRSETIRRAFATYHLEKTDALIFSHRDNFNNLNNEKKNLVYFIVERDGFLTVNYGIRKHFYVGNDLANNFSHNLIKLCARPNGSISKRNIDIYARKTGLIIPYKRLYRYTLISTFPSDNVWFDRSTAIVDPNKNVFMKYELTNEKYEVLTDQSNDPVFPTRLLYRSHDYSYVLTDVKFNILKNYNDNSDSMKDLKIEAIKLSREHLYFLYDNKSLVRETFITELNKKIYLIGSIAFYDKGIKTGKAFLVENDRKLKFDFKENQIVENLIFNLSHATKSAKILLKENNIYNFLLISTEKLTRIGQKKKMVEIIDKIIVKALQNYDKYTTLNPLEINLQSNYLSKIIDDYKGFVFEVRLINVLFSANITNDTQNIFITCQNLVSAKKALINDKIYYLLGIINLNEIKQWKEMKGKSLYVNAKIDDSHYMQTAKHFGFAFKTSFPTEFLEFTCEFLDDQAKKIVFADGEEKVPIIDLVINILK